MATLIGAMLWAPVWAGNAPPASAASTTWKCPLLALAALNKVPPPSAPVLASDRRNCLITASALDQSGAHLFDVRDRAHYNDFHVPGARQTSVTALATMPGTAMQSAIVYDGGLFRSDALLLCNRLRHAGFRQVHVVDGGIAAWAQLHALPQTMMLNRLSDNDVAAALHDPGNRIVALTEPLRLALPPSATTHAAEKPARVIVLAEPATSQSAIRARLKKGITTLYWTGSAQRLRRLLARQLVQNQKRLAGPGVSKTCDAL